MDAMLGTWRLQYDRNEGPGKEVIQAMGIPEAFVDMFVKAVYTLVVEKSGEGGYVYTFTMDGSPEKHVAGPFMLGQPFTFYDKLCNRTEEITISLEKDKIKEVTKIKEDPNVTWTLLRYLQGGDMVSEQSSGGKTSKSYLSKI